MRHAQSIGTVKASLAVTAAALGLTTAAWALVYFDYLSPGSRAHTSSLTHIGVPPRQTDELFDARHAVDDWSCRPGC